MTQRFWVLVRHAQAEARAASGEDRERGLTEHGQRDAAAAAQFIARQLAGRSAVLLSSPAGRARSTAAPIAGLLDKPVHEQDAIYDATPGDLLAILNEQNHPEASVLVGHNPGIEQALALLTEGRSDEYRGMPTAAVAWLQVPEGVVEPGTARLVAFWSP